MSITERAIEEMQRAGFDDRDIEQMKMILILFFERWNSGGAVWGMVPVLKRCLCGMPLTPLTGENDEWICRNEYEKNMYQNKRCSSVFKRDGHVYDIENHHWDGAFPYFPRNHNLDPTMNVKLKDE